MEQFKGHFIGLVGVLGSSVTWLLGGWDTGVQTLLIFMGIDYVTGFILAGVFNRSNKTESGALESKAGWKGLCRKGVVLFIILIAVRLDLMLETGNIIRNAAVITFCINETISVIENIGLMGVPIPPIIDHSIALLKKKEKRSIEK